MGGSIVARRSAERGASEHGGWLSSKFTFSFAGYSDPRFDSFGVLRVLNDDTVKSGGGFPTHSHANFGALPLPPDSPFSRPTPACQLLLQTRRNCRS
jgi:hypothetical protein